jgi:hypothetical protein
MFGIVDVDQPLYRSSSTAQSTIVRISELTPTPLPQILQHLQVRGRSSRHHSKTIVSRRSTSSATMRSSKSAVRNLWLRCQLLAIPKLLRRIPPLVVAVVTIQAFWFYYDATITSQRYHRPKRKPVRVTESSPLSPFYPPSPGQDYRGFARAFPVWTQPYPCGPLMEESGLSTRKPTAEGLIFIQEMEVASTMFAGITARIARRMGALERQKLSQQEQQQQQQPDRLRIAQRRSATPSNTTKICTARLVPVRAIRFMDRIRQKSFLWSVVREPVDRLVHKYFHYGTHRPKRGRASLLRPHEQPEFEISATRLQDFTIGQGQDLGYYFRSLTILSNINPYNVDSYERFVQVILESYDFIGVSERMDESLVVLQLLLGLETQDLLYLPTAPKATNNNNDINDPTGTALDYYEQWGNNECRPVPEAKVTVEMKEWLYSEEFEAFVQGDVMFYKAVNASLDITIDALGRDRVQRGVKQLQWALALAREACPNVQYPCSSNGEMPPKTDCIFSNVACGYECLDTVGANIATNPDFQALSV